MATAVSKSMELEGNLRSFHLPEIMRFLAMGRMTGTLTLRGGERTVELLIKEGRLVGTSAPERFIKLGQLLVYNGLLSRKSLNDVLELQQAGDHERMLGELLIERKLVTSEQVEQALLLQLKEELWELFSWTDGTFNFEHGASSALKRALLELEIEPLVAEGLERLEQWRALARNLNEGDEVFQVRADLNAMPEARLNPNEWRVLALVNGRLSVRALVCLAGIGRFETFCALDRLLQLQFIEPVEASPRRANGRSQGELRIVPMESIQKPAHARKADDDEADERGSNFLSRLTRRKRGPAAGEREAVPPVPGAAEAQVGPYLTAIGWACALLNRLVDCMLGEGAGPVDVAALWREHSARYPKSDLIELCHGSLDATEFERFVQLIDGIDAALLGAHEEGLAALAALGGALVAQARSQLGGRADSFINEVLRPYLDHIEIKHPGDFAPRQWCENMKQ